MENTPSLNNEIGHQFGHRMSKFNKKNIFYLIAIIGALLLIYFLFFSAPRDFSVNSMVNIKEGSSLRYISKYLEKKHIIRSRVVFETFVIIFKDDKHLVAGDYFLESRLPVFEIARRMSKGERHLAPVRVTIPEGFNISDISKAFSLKLQNFNKKIFLQKAKTKEGYLFPDTYFFFTTDNEEDVLRSMTNNFKKKILSFKPSIKSSGETEKNIIIMASLIEKEAKGDIDRRVISGILWKRLLLNMPLQVDVDLNTYKVKGLPQNPISNPGIKSIEAAINPKISKYLYYLHDKNGNIHYASTFSEHLLNRKKYLSRN